MVRVSVSLSVMCLGWLSAASPTKSDSRPPATELLQSPGITQDALQALIRRQDPTKPSEMLALALGSLSNNFKHHPISKVPVTQQQPSFYWPGAIQKKIRYGPYHVPARSKSDAESRLLHMKGVALNVNLQAQKPCDGDCVITALQTTMEYEDGSPADNLNGVWLHHTVIVKTGPNATEMVCRRKGYDILFESGNEKSQMQFSVPGSPIRSGYHLQRSDNFILGTELVGLDDKEKWVWLAITYDYLEGKQTDFRPAKIVFNYIGPPSKYCGGAAVNPFGKSNLTTDMKPLREVFTEASIPWKPAIDGVMLGFGGHLHDGGLGLRVYKNRVNICNSTTHYAKTPTDKLYGGFDEMHFQMQHIIKQDFCTLEQGIPLLKTDELHFEVDYDMTKYPGMRDSQGKLDEVGGALGLLFVYDEQVS